MSKKTVKVVMELPELPEGYEYTGEYRSTVINDYYLNCDDMISQATYCSAADYPIVRKCDVWRDATLQDVADALSGKEVVARYGGDMHRIAGGQLSTAKWRAPSFLLQREDGSTFWVGACEVRVS